MSEKSPIMCLSKSHNTLFTMVGPKPNGLSEDIDKREVNPRNNFQDRGPLPGRQVLQQHYRGQVRRLFQDF